VDPLHDFRAADHDLGAGAIGSSGSRVARLSVRVSPSRCPSPARLLHAGNRGIAWPLVFLATVRIQGSRS